jgi:hypothetical protein
VTPHAWRVRVVATLSAALRDGRLLTAPCCDAPEVLAERVRDVALDTTSLQLWCTSCGANVLEVVTPAERWWLTPAGVQALEASP